MQRVFGTEFDPVATISESADTVSDAPPLSCSVTDHLPPTLAALVTSVRNRIFDRSWKCSAYRSRYSEYSSLREYLT